MKILFFDLETTGLFAKDAHYSTDFNEYPYPVQVAWALVNEDQQILIKQSHIIKPVGWEIPQDATEIHNITTDHAKTVGMDMKTVLRHLIVDAQVADKIVAHNIYFDTSIIKANLLRLKVDPEITNKALDKDKRTDTMRKTIKFVEARYDDGRIGKWPSLEELYVKLFDKKMQKFHDAGVDVETLMACYFELVKLEIL